jgi:hypothetical protein
VMSPTSAGLVFLVTSSLSILPITTKLNASCAHCLTALPVTVRTSVLSAPPDTS